MRRLEKWPRIDVGWSVFYPLCIEPSGENSVARNWTVRREWLRQNFPELWCWLWFNAQESEWDLSFSSMVEENEIYLLIDPDMRPQFEAAWEDHIE
jgi:hypothetical protein